MEIIWDHFILTNSKGFNEISLNCKTFFLIKKKADATVKNHNNRFADPNINIIN